MIRKAIIVAICLGVSIFVAKNVYMESAKKIPQKKEPVLKSADDKEIYHGQFKGMDSIHNVKGDAVVMETATGPVLRFERFSSTPGPDLVVYLSQNENVTFTKDLGAQYVTLGSLTKISGDQVYTLPKEYKDYKSVIIWSRAFSILFGAAPMK